MGWSAPQRPIEYAEQALVTAILDGQYVPGSQLPSERDLAGQLGVTRPTLREALRRLERDGWLTIRQGKSTRVNDFWEEGELSILTAIVRYRRALPPNFVLDLLEVRLSLAPRYTERAVAKSPAEVIRLLVPHTALDADAGAYAKFDWALHHGLTVASQNPVYTLILNGFSGFYEYMAARYFSNPAARSASQEFYQALLTAAIAGDATAAEQITRQAMAGSMSLWEALEREIAAENGSGA
jgi:GntR family negative regulator for fad regulon and positive regulator of fabA